MTVAFPAVARRWLRLTLAPLLVASAAALGTGAHGADVGTKRSLEERSADALFWGDLDDLERIYALARDPARRTSQGRAELSEFLNGVGRVMRGGDSATEGYHLQIVALTRRWTIDRPDSVLAKLLHLRALYQRAWFARGGGYANTVPPQAMAAFEREMRHAGGYVTAHWSVMRSESAAYVYALMVGRSAGWTAQQQWALARDGLDKDPDNDGIYQELLGSMLPEWGGSPERIDEVVREALTRTADRRGLMMYALLYQELVHRDGAAVFKQSGVDWPRMRQSYRDWLERYPDPAIVNRFALAACLAQDRDTLVELLSRVGGEPLLREWGRGTEGTQRFDTCRRWARGG